MRHRERLLYADWRAVRVGRFNWQVEVDVTGALLYRMRSGRRHWTRRGAMRAGSRLVEAVFVASRVTGGDEA